MTVLVRWESVVPLAMARRRPIAAATANTAYSTQAVNVAVEGDSRPSSRCSPKTTTGPRASTARTVTGEARAMPIWLM